MEADEKIYLRLSMDGKKCSSRQLAESFKQGRVSPDEKFELNGNILTFSEIRQNDPCVNSIVGNGDLPRFETVDELKKQIGELRDMNVWLSDLAQESYLAVHEAYLVLTAMLPKLQGNDSDSLSLQQTTYALQKSFERLSGTLEEDAKIDLIRHQYLQNRINLFNDYCDEVTREFKKEYARLSEQETCCRERIKEEKIKAIESLKSDIKLYTELRVALGECKESIRSFIEWYFPHTPPRCYSSKIPKNKLINVIMKYSLDVVPNDVLALYDASLFGNVKKWIIVTYKAIYIYDGITSNHAIVFPIGPDVRFQISSYFFHTDISFKNNKVAIFRKNDLLMRFVLSLNKLCSVLYEESAYIRQIEDCQLNLDFKSLHSLVYKTYITHGSTGSQKPCQFEGDPNK